MSGPGPVAAGARASYDDKQDTYFGHRREEMAAFVPLAARTLLEVGCGGGGFAAHLKASRALHVTAIEAHPEAAAIAATRLDRVLCASIENALPQLAGAAFDCIVLNDVLEHLVDPWTVLRQLRALLGAQGVVVASLPNVRYLPVFKDYVLRGRWRYENEGVMDRTHLRFFTATSMRELFEAAGYAVERQQGINAIQVSWKFKLLDALTRGALADTQFQQFACVAHAAAPGA